MALLLFFVFLFCCSLITTSNTKNNSEIESSINLKTNAKCTICYGEWCLITSLIDEPQNVSWSFNSNNPDVDITVLFMTYSEYWKFEHDDPYIVTSVLSDGSKAQDSGTHMQANGTTWAYVFMHNDSDPEAQYTCPRITYDIQVGPSTGIPSYEFFFVFIALIATVILLQVRIRKSRFYFA